MKKRLILLMSLSIFFFGFTLSEAFAKTTSSVPTSFQMSVKKQLKTAVPIVLPTKIFNDKNSFINASTTATKNSYKVVYYSLPKQFSVNASAVKKTSQDQAVARITGKKYASKELAKKKLANQVSLSKSSKIKIQKGLYGFIEAGAGSQWLSWKKENWFFVSQNMTNKTKENIEFAKTTMNFLQQHKLPKINQTGIIYFGENAQNYYAKWQQDTTVYEITLVKDSTELLTVLTSLNGDF